VWQTLVFEQSVLTLKQSDKLFCLESYNRKRENKSKNIDKWELEISYNTLVIHNSAVL